MRAGRPISISLIPYRSKEFKINLIAAHYKTYRFSKIHIKGLLTNQYAGLYISIYQCVPVYPKVIPDLLSVN